MLEPRIRPVRTMTVEVLPWPTLAGMSLSMLAECHKALGRYVRGHAARRLP